MQHTEPITTHTNGDGVMYYRYRGFNCDLAPDQPLLEEQHHDGFRIRLVEIHGSVCYSVCLDSPIGLLRVRCCTDAEEKHFPKSAAHFGTQMVKLYNDRNGKSREATLF